MRKFIITFFALLIVFSLSYSQDVFTSPKSYEWVQIYPLAGESGLVGVDSDGLDTTANFQLSGLNGNAMLWFEFGDTTGLGANESTTNYDSCLTVYLDEYNSRTGLWGNLYNNSTGRLDTLDRALIVTNNKSLYMNLPEFEDFQTGGKRTYGRIRMAIGVDDSLVVKRIFFGAQ